MATNEANVVVWRKLPTGEPFGMALPEEDPNGDGRARVVNLRFPGQYFDRETLLHYNYFRDYDPQTGRYIQSDPIGLNGGLIRELGERHTILLSTHILTEVESTCSRAIVIAKGKLVAEGPLAGLRERRRANRARLLVRTAGRADAATIARLVAELSDEADVSKAKAAEEIDGLIPFTLTFGKDADPGEALEALIGRLYERGHKVREATLLSASLDEVFSELTEDCVVDDPSADEATEAAT